MRLAGVIGWPVAHSKSPVIHRFWLEALGEDGDYCRLGVPPEHFAAAVRALPLLGFAGVNVTIPHKEAALALASRATPAAAAIGAANILAVEPDGGLLADNSDWLGFAETIADRSVRHAIVVGAGGAARAILFALKERGVGAVTLMNRTPARAQALLAASGLAGEVRPLDAPLPPADLLVQTSPLGMAGQPPFLPDLAPLAPDALVEDIVYAPLETPLLAAARAHGLATVDGLAMLIGQAAPAFTRFFGASPPRARDAELRQLLTRPAPSSGVRGLRSRPPEA
ncbi:MAG: shikimate dehydrogenase [Sphingomonadaceae bacterium]